MKARRILLCQLIALVLTALLVAGCQDNRQLAWQQEKLKLQQTIEAQQDEIDRLKRSSEVIFKLFAERLAEQAKYQQQPAAVEKEDENLSKPRKITPEQVKRLKEGLAELEQMRRIKAERFKAEAAAEARENK